MKNPIKKDAPLQIRLSLRERQRWHAAARALDLTLAEMVREAMRSRVAAVVRVARVDEPVAPEAR